MHHGHTVDKQHQVATAIIEQRRSGGEFRLLNNLIAAITCGNFLAVIDFQRNLLAVILHIVRIITTDRCCTAVDEFIERKRSFQIIDVVDNLLHLSLSQRIVAEAHRLAVILIEDIRPILNKLFLRVVLQDLTLPTVLLEHFYKRVFKLRFGIERLMTHKSEVLTNILSRQACLMLRSLTSF